jgi:hypothetical protein
MSHQRGKPHGGRPKPHVESHLPKLPKAPERPSPRSGSFISRRDERGVPYRGDWPNPVADKTRGCF